MGLFFTRKRAIVILLIGLAVSSALAGVWFFLKPASAVPTPGTLLRDLGPYLYPTISPNTAVLGGNCTGNNNCSYVGVGFDGISLYVTNVPRTILSSINPTTGQVLANFPISNSCAGISVISWDQGRGMFWAARGTDIFLITNTGTCSSSPQFSVATLLPGNCLSGCSGLVDGINYDRTSDTVWYSPDKSHRVYRYAASSGALLNFFDIQTPNDFSPQCPSGTGNSGVATGSQNVMYLAADGCQYIFLYTKSGTKLNSFLVPATRHEDLECDSNTFASLGTDAVWSKDSIDGHIRAFAVAQGTCIFGGGPTSGSSSFSYTAKWICNLPSPNGTVDTAAARTIGLVPGEYQTDINVHNPNQNFVQITKKFVISVPESPLVNASSVAYDSTVIGPDDAFFINCGEILKQFQDPAPANPSTTQTQDPTGLVCVDVSTSTSCPSVPPTFTGLSQGTLTIAVNIQGSDAIDDYDIYVKADNTILKATSVNPAGLLGASPLILTDCIDNVPIIGSCTPFDGQGIVHFAATGPLTSSPITGRLFTITYNILGTTPGIPVGFQTGCPGTSVANTCVTISNGTSAVDSETVQAGNFANLPDFSLSSSPPSLSLNPGGCATKTITVTSINGFSGSVTLTSVLASGFTWTIVPNVITLGTSGTATKTVCAALSVAPGSYTETITGTSNGITHNISETDTVVTPPLQTAKGFVILTTTAANLDVVAEYSAESIDPATKAQTGISLDIVQISSVPNAVPPPICSPGSTISVAPNPLALPIGASGQAQVTITNTGCTPLTECLSLAAPPGIIASVTSSCITLPAGPGTTGAATVTVACTLKGTFQIGITATSTSSPPIIQKATLVVKCG